LLAPLIVELGDLLDFLASSFATDQLEVFLEVVPGVGVVVNSRGNLHLTVYRSIDHRLSEDDPVLNFLIFSGSGVLTELNRSVSAVALTIEFQIATSEYVQDVLYVTCFSNPVQHVAGSQAAAETVVVRSSALWNQLVDGTLKPDVETVQSLEGVYVEVVCIVVNVKPASEIGRASCRERV